MGDGLELLDELGCLFGGCGRVLACVILRRELREKKEGGERGSDVYISGS